MWSNAERMTCDTRANNECALIFTLIKQFVLALRIAIQSRIVGHTNSATFLTPDTLFLFLVIPNITPGKGMLSRIQ